MKSDISKCYFYTILCYFYTENGKENTVKIEISSKFIKSLKINQVIYDKTVWGELKGHFELHLAQISDPRTPKVKNLPYIWPYHGLYPFLGVFFTNVIDFRPNFGRKSAENIFFGKSSWNWSENIYTIFKSNRYFFLNLWFCTPVTLKSFYEI